MTKTNQTIPQQNIKRNNKRQLTEDPELRDALLDVAEFSQKYKPANIAKLVGTTKSAITYHLNVRKKKEKK
jgi:hypothetical protein